MNHKPIVVVGFRVKLRVVGPCVGCSGCVGATVSVVGTEDGNRDEWSYPKS